MSKLKTLAVVITLLLTISCVRMKYFYITLSDDCVATAIEEFKQEELSKDKIKGRSFAVKHDDLYIGTIKFDNKLNLTFNSIAETKQSNEIVALVDDINTNKKIKILANRYFEMRCFSSQNVPIWAQYQDIDIIIELKDPLFLSALKYYLSLKGVRIH